MWQLSDSFSDEKNHKAVSHPALLMLVKLNYLSTPSPHPITLRVQHFV